MSEKKLEIEFGELFIPQRNGTLQNKLQVISDVGDNGNNFLVFTLDPDAKRPTIPLISGETARPENFGIRAGKMSLKQLVEARKRGYVAKGMKPSENIATMLKEAAQKKQRTIVWQA